MSRKRIEEVLREHLQKITEEELSERDLVLLVEEVRAISRKFSPEDLSKSELETVRALISRIITLIEGKLACSKNEMLKKKKGLNAFKVYMLNYRD